MNQFALNNKLSKVAHFELGECEAFDFVQEAALIPVSATIENRIGSETVLMLIDKTPFIYTLAKVRPFDLMLKAGMVQTSHGPLAFLLFYVPNASEPDAPYFTYDLHLNPFNSGLLATWRDLARQSHWHLVLVDADQEVQDVLEFPNIYGLGETLAAISNAVRELRPGDFDLAKQEFCEQYSLSDLMEM